MKIISYLKKIGLFIVSFLLYELLMFSYVIPKSLNSNKEMIGKYHFVLYVATIALVMLVYHIYKKQLEQENDWHFNEKPHFKWSKLGYSGLAFVVMIAAQVLINIFLSSSSNSANQKAIDQLAKGTDWHFIVFIIFLAPMFEEIILRGQFFNIAFTKENKLNYWLGIVINGLFFAWLHDPTFSIHIITYWVMGAILATTYLNTKDLRYSFVTHMLNNTIAALPLILGMH